MQMLVSSQKSVVLTKYNCSVDRIMLDLKRFIYRIYAKINLQPRNVTRKSNYMSIEAKCLF